jgi:hypothetical protein
MNMKSTLILTLFLAAPLALLNASPTDPPAGQSVAEKMILPKIVFRDASIKEATDFLNRKIREISPDRKAVAIVLSGPEDHKTRIDLDMTNRSLADVVKKLAEIGRLEMHRW